MGSEGFPLKFLDLVTRQQSGRLVIRSIFDGLNRTSFVKQHGRIATELNALGDEVLPRPDLLNDLVIELSPFGLSSHFARQFVEPLGQTFSGLTGRVVGLSEERHVVSGLERDHTFEQVMCRLEA